MTSVWLGFFAILGAGILVLLIAALADRRTRLRTEGHVTSSSDEPVVPGSVPGYMTATELLRRSDLRPVDAASQAALRGAPAVALTLASPDLDTHEGRSVATDARVLVSDDAVLTLRELLPIWGAMKPGQALTIAAPAFDPSVIDALVANTRGGVRVVQAVVGEADARAILADLTVATPVSRADLQAGAVPVTALGHARLISADGRATLVAV